MRSAEMIIFSVLLMCLSVLKTTCNGTEPMVKPESIKGKSVAEIVDMMTLEEKLGQMTQVDRQFLDDINDIERYKLGSLISGGGSTPEVNTPKAWADMLAEFQKVAMETRLGIPLIYGIDAVHGHNNVVGATVIPHHIGLGATRDPDLVRKLARMTACEVRATGINWTFGPCLANSRDERWGRSYEGFSEYVDLINTLGKAEVEGFQGRDLAAPDAIAACAKHFAGDGGTVYGTGLNGRIDRGDTRLDETSFMALHVDQYRGAIEAGTATVMASFNSWNGLKCHGNKYLLTDMLRDELGFDGFVVSDWRGHEEISGDYKADLVRAINAGIDMIMVPGDSSNGGKTYHEFYAIFKESAEEGLIPMKRIDEAVTRILEVKNRMGLLDSAPLNDGSLLATVGSDAHRRLARQAVRESVVLLKNNGILPLAKNARRIVVAGRGADDIGMQCGGWTVEWQGNHGDILPGTSILKGVSAAVSKTTEIVHSRDGSSAAGADAVILVVGEDPYAEMVGDREKLALSEEDLSVIERVKTAGVPMVIVLLSGRPMIVSDVIESSNAFLAAWLPGTEGDGVTDVIFGDYAPTGKLPFSWPVSMDQIPINVGDSDYTPLYEFGFGLTYNHSTPGGA